MFWFTDYFSRRDVFVTASTSNLYVYSPIMLIFKSQIFMAGCFRHVFIVTSVLVCFCNAGVVNKPNISYPNARQAVPGGLAV